MISTVHNLLTANLFAALLLIVFFTKPYWGAHRSFDATCETREGNKKKKNEIVLSCHSNVNASGVLFLQFSILSNGTWKDLCITNWNDAERNLVCQEQGYNGSSLEVYSNSGTNGSGNTIRSCEQLTQNCEKKISRGIKCSGIRTFLSPQNKSRMKRMWIDTSNNIAVLTLSIK